MIQILESEPGDRDYWPRVIVREGFNHYKIVLHDTLPQVDHWQVQIAGPAYSYQMDHSGPAPNPVLGHLINAHDAPLRLGALEGTEDLVYAQLLIMLGQVESIAEFIDLLRMSDTL